MDIVTIDFETYYDQEYSLSKMTTEAYVRDPRFEVIGVGVKINGEPTDTYSGDNPGRFLKSLDYSRKAILCHHTAFDGAILSWHFGIRPALWLDTLSMSRPKYKLTVGGSLSALAQALQVGIKGTEVVAAKGKRRADFTPQELRAYMGYCANDVELTYKIFQLVKQGFPVEEIQLIDQILRMYTEPELVLDAELLATHLAQVKASKLTLLKEVAASFGTGLDLDGLKDMLMSNPKFASILERMNVPIPMKVSKRTGKESYAFAKTDPGMLELLEYPDERVAAIAAARMGVKSTLEETRTEALLGVTKRGALPIFLNYHGAHTGRLSGGDGLNFQNLPARTSKAIRKAVLAPPGHVLVVSDLSQIEARVVAYIAGQEDLVDAFRNNRDVYSEFATEVYGRTITKADKPERFVGKTCILGLGYGMGGPKLGKTLAIGQGGISVTMYDSETREVVQVYRRKYHHIPKLWRIADHVLHNILAGNSGEFAKVLRYDHEGILLPNGLRITYPGLQQGGDNYEYLSDPRTFRKFLKNKITQNEEVKFTEIYGGKVVENITQALAAIVIKKHMLEVAKAGYKVVLQVHDEIIACVPEDQAEQAVVDIRTIMSTPPEWAPDLPVACEIGYARAYGEVVKK